VIGDKLYLLDCCCSLLPCCCRCWLLQLLLLQLHTYLTKCIFSLYVSEFNVMSLNSNNMIVVRKKKNFERISFRPNICRLDIFRPYICRRNIFRPNFCLSVKAQCYKTVMVRFTFLFQLILQS
jgi:hypothetical protein